MARSNNQTATMSITEVQDLMISRISIAQKIETLKAANFKKTDIENHGINYRRISPCDSSS